MSLEIIESLAGKHAGARIVLGEHVAGLKKELERIARSYKSRINRAVTKVASTHVALEQAIEAEPELFESPRTFVFSGLKVGLQRGKQTLEYDDEKCLIKMIRAKFSELFPVLVEVQESVNDAALNTLSKEELKQLNVTIIEADDHILIKPATGGVDKAITAMVKDATKEAESGE